LATVNLEFFHESENSLPCRTKRTGGRGKGNEGGEKKPRSGLKETRHPEKHERGVINPGLDRTRTVPLKEREIKHKEEGGIQKWDQKGKLNGRDTALRAPKASSLELSLDTTRRSEGSACGPFAQRRGKWFSEEGQNSRGKLRE